MGDGFCQAYGRAKVGVLAYDDGDFVPLFVGGLHQVYGKADVNALFLSADVYLASIYVDAPAP